MLSTMQRQHVLYSCALFVVYCRPTSNTSITACLLLLLPPPPLLLLLHC
jgi:hypothetical protein